MQLEAGATISHYRLLEPLGQGGMGVVWKAHDTQLGRDVALKVLPDLFSRDPERLARFEREARLLASLSHPHIAAIYDLHTAEDLHFLTLELVEGPDLSQRIAEGGLSLEETLRLALQIAEALEHAHEKGIVHRDLKPANVKLTSNGQIKVLDFGLAKALEADAASGSGTSLAQSPTITGDMTAANVLLGTAGYMAPEQARGQPADRRADIWAFGVVLLELLSGRRVFAGDTISDTLASVLKTDPDWKNLPAKTPRRIRALLHRCLERDARRRLRDIGEARVVLEDTLRGDAEEPEPTRTMSSRPALVLGALGGLLLGVLVTFAILQARRPEVASIPHRQFHLAPAVPDAVPRNPAISPDGKMVAYVAGERLWLQELAKLEPQEVAVVGEPIALFWSPDGESLGYVVGTRILKVSANGGESQMVTDARSAFTGGSGATWLEDGSIVFSRADSVGLLRVAAVGGDPRPLVPTISGEESDLHEPSTLPGGRGILFCAHRNRGIDNISLWADGERKLLLELPGQTLSFPQYAASGHILFHRTPTTRGIWALPFSLSRLEVTGEPFLVAESGDSPSVAGDGTLAYQGGNSASETQLVWVDRSGEELEIVGPPQIDADPIFSASPDGLRAARGEGESDNADIWIYDSRRGTRTRLTFDPGYEGGPEWSAAGDRIVYHARELGCESSADCWSVLSRRADGTGKPDTLGLGVFPSFTRDGKHVIWVALEEQGLRWDICMAPSDGHGKPQTLVRGNSRAVDGRISPRGNLMAYVSNESGQMEVYLTRFPGAEGRWQVSVAGGQWPRWSRRGDRLYYVERDDVMEVEIGGDATPVLGTPRRLFTRQALGTWAFGFYNSFDASGDGRRFLIARSVDEENRPAGVTVVQNWFAPFESAPR